MLIIKDDNSGKDLNDFWLESKIINCCSVVKYTQPIQLPININSIHINELYNEFDDTYSNPSEKLKKLNNILIFDNNNNNYVNKKYNIKNQRNRISNNGNFRSNNFRNNFTETNYRNQTTNNRVFSKKISYPH